MFHASLGVFLRLSLMERKARYTLDTSSNLPEASQFRPRASSEALSGIVSTRQSEGA